MKKWVLFLLALSLIVGVPATDALSPPVLTEEQIDWALKEAGYPWLDREYLEKHNLAISILPAENDPEKGVVVFGTADFVKAVWRAFNLMNAQELAFVRDNTRRIQMPVLIKTRAVVQKGITYTSPEEWFDWAEKYDDNADVILAGILIHEAAHHNDWKICFLGGGIEIEARAISRELAFYSRYYSDVDGWAQAQREQIGSHGKNKPGMNNPQCGLTIP